MGLQFLRHIERTEMLLWVIDASSEDVFRDFTTLLNELLLYRADVARRERVIVLNKIDLIGPEALKLKEDVLTKIGEEVIPISAASGWGVDRLKERIGGQEGKEGRWVT